MFKLEKKVVLGVPIYALTFSQVTEIIVSFIKQKTKKKVFYVNAHCLNLANSDSKYKKILEEADLVYSGGIGPIVASKILEVPLKERTPTPDFVEKIFKLAQKNGWTFYFIGTNEYSLTMAIDKLKAKFPYLKIKGYHSGFFSDSEEEKIIQELNKCKPTIVIVGMGTPKQEKWISSNIDKIDAKIFWAVGAMFDVISGELPRAPKWIQKIGLEWFYRLLQEPSRLWRRYTIGNIQFIWRVSKAFIKQKPLKSFFIFTTLLEIIIIACLINNIYHKYTNILGTSLSTYPIRSGDYLFSTGELKYFYEPKPNSVRTDSVDWLSYQTTYHLNNEGFNSSKDYSIEKAANTYRIITLGDSHTYGIYVDPSKNYPSQLENLLNSNSCKNGLRFEIINLGVPGYDLQYEIKRFEKRGLKYSPDLVIWHLKEDDFFQINELINERSEALKKEMESNGQLKQYESQGSYYPYRSIAQEQLIKEIGIKHILEIQRDLIKKSFKEYHNKLVIFNYSYGYERYKSLITSLQTEREQTYLYGPMRVTEDETLRLPDKHPNERGYSLIANNLFNFLQSNKIIPCD